jgi:enterobactin synthetase component D
MHTTYSTFLLAGQTVHHVEFDPTTFTDADLLWLPHHAHLTHAGRKRKTDHLAGRIAAAHALHALNEHTLRASVPVVNHSGRRGFQAALPTAVSRQWRLLSAINIC